MTELKTLKDLGLKNLDSEERSKIYDGETLRKEAIKWVKHLEDGIVCGCEAPIEGNVLSKEMEATTTNIAFTGMIKWIKDFFNLTEEDLK